jgi:hypothetical protein
MEDMSEPSSSWAFRKEYLVLACTVGAGLLISSVYAVGVQQNGLKVFAATFMLAGASLLGSVVLGFLFGIPRTVQGETEQMGQPGRKDARQTFRANNSLEQVSDWLTKVLIGVGLAQLALLPSGLQTVGAYWADLFGGDTSAGVFSLVVAGYFAFCGFLLGYIWARVDFYQTLVTSETEFQEIKDAVEQEERQRRADADAEKLVYQTLNPEAGQQPVPQERLNEAISSASTAARTTFFYLAKKQRSEYWDTDKAKLDRVIPIFRALIHSDEKETGQRPVYHRNFGQLGYALKDKLSPDYEGAVRSLTNAINIRDSQGLSGWILYEFNRAYCRIKLDPDFEEKKPSAPRVCTEINKDLAEVAHSDQRELLQDPTVAEWLQVNEITQEQLLNAE